MKTPVSIREIDEQIAVHEKQIALLQMAKTAMERRHSNSIDEARYSRAGIGWDHMIKWHSERVERNTRIAARVLRMYYQLTLKFCNP
jgi:hypothetical protein